MTAVQWNRGFRRLTILVSSVVLAIGLLWSAAYGLNEKPGWPMYLGAVLLAIAFASVPWLIFVSARWLARGFREDGRSAEAPKPGGDSVESMRLVEELADRLAAGTISHDMVESILGSLSPDQLLLMQQMQANSLKSTEKKKQEIIDKGAKEGKTISTEVLLRSVTRAKASYGGPDREGYARSIDEMMNAIHQRYGPEIPVDEAYRLMKDLEPSSKERS